MPRRATMARHRRIFRLAAQICEPTPPEDVKFVSLSEGARMSGVRITHLPGGFPVWAEALRNFLDAKGVAYTRMVHPWGPEMGGPPDGQAELFRLTAQTSLPTMLYNDERPRSSWLEQMKLADQLGSGPSLIPAEPQDRVRMFGLMNELLAEDGALYNKRRAVPKKSDFMLKYGWSEEAAKEAPRKVAESISVFVDQLRSQKAKGSRYLIGSSLSALDIYWASGAMFLGVIPGTDIMPLTKQNRGLLKMFKVTLPEVQKVYDTDGAMELIREHQAYILKTYCKTPAALGGTPA